MGWSSNSGSLGNHALGLVGIAAEERDGSSVLGGDLDIIDAGSPGSTLFFRLGDQDIAELGWVDEGDLCALRDGHPIAGIAGKGEGAVGKREDQTAMAGCMAVQHIVTDDHAKHRVARADRFDRHAKRFGRLILRINDPGDLFRETLLIRLRDHRPFTTWMRG